MLRLLLGLVAGGWALACWAQQLPAEAQAGDLIFRLGTERVSQLVQAVDQGRFSHVGLLVGKPGQWQVLHATPSERPGQADAVVLDALAFFLAPARSQAYAVYQVRGANAASRQQAVQWALRQQGRPFHLLDSAQGIYCTTLVWQAWQQAGVVMDVQFTTVALPVIGGQFLLPSALQVAQQLQLLSAGAAKMGAQP